MYTHAHETDTKMKKAEHACSISPQNVQLVASKRHLYTDHLPKEEN